MKETLCSFLDSLSADIWERSDYIFDHPECDGQERQASEILTRWLEENGFTVEKGIGGLETAFRAVFERGSSSPSIGLLCEYDALQGIGHACAHHMQGPVMVAAALAIQSVLKEENYKLVLYGTPAEETSGGKITMLNNGCFKDIDAALMVHGAPDTCTDVKSMACNNFLVTFHGKSAHAAIAPEMGRSALDALLLTFQGVEFLREHVKEDTKMHYSVINGGGPSNVVQETASGDFCLRSYNNVYLDNVISRFHNIVKGAALMAGVEYEILPGMRFDSKIPVPSLNSLLMDNAALLNAPRQVPPRERTGATDFGNVMHCLPGSCLRIAFVPHGTSSHSPVFLQYGKAREAHEAELLAAKIIASTAYDLIKNPALLQSVKEDFQQHQQQEKE